MQYSMLKKAHNDKILIKAVFKYFLFVVYDGIDFIQIIENRILG